MAVQNVPRRLELQHRGWQRDIVYFGSPIKAFGNAVVPESYQNYKNSSVMKQLTDVGREGECFLGWERTCQRRYRDTL